MVFRGNEQSEHTGRRSYQQTSTHHQMSHFSLSYTKESTEYANQSQDERDQLVEKKNPHKKSYHPQTPHTIHGAHPEQR